VTQGQHDLLCRQGVGLASALIEHLKTLQPMRVVQLQVGHALLEADLAAQGRDLLSDAFDHLDQFEGADVGVRGKQDVAGRSGLHELVHHLAAQMPRVLDLAVELAIREGAGAAFAELHIALGLQHFFAPETPGVLGPLAYRFAAFEHDGSETHLRQRQCRQHAAGAKAHHHRAFARLGAKADGGLHWGAPGHVGRGLDVRVLVKLLQQHGLAFGLHEREVDDEDGQQFGFARIKAAFEDVQGSDVGGGNAQGFGGQFAQRGLGVRRGQPVFVGFGRRINGAAFFDRQGGQGEFEFGNADHGGGLWLSSRA